MWHRREWDRVGVYRKKREWIIHWVQKRFNNFVLYEVAILRLSVKSAKSKAFVSVEIKGRGRVSVPIANFFLCESISDLIDCISM